MKEKILFKRKVGLKGDSMAIVIPKALVDYLGLSNGDEMMICADDGKYGKFLSMWTVKE